MTPPVRVSLRIRRKHFDAIVSGEKAMEIRRYSSFWISRLERIRLGKIPAIATFVCGKRIHRRRIVSIKVGYAWQFLDRPPLIRDVGTGLIYAIFLGKEET